MSSSKVGNAVVVTLCLAVAAGVGYAIHKATKKRNEQRAVVSMVTDTTAQLKSALKSASPEVLEQVEGNLRVTKSWSNIALAQAAEEYLVGAREIMRRRAEADRLSAKAASSRAALAAHMNRAERRDSRWIQTASALKKRVEAEHFELDVKLKALAELLETLPEANKPLAPYVQASLLLDDESRTRAKDEVIAEARRASLELEKTRSILPR
jgi:hypothetical protein